MSSAEGVAQTALGVAPGRLNPQVHRLFNPFPPNPPTPFYGDGVDKITRRVGPGGSCPHCDEPVAVNDLVEEVAG